MDYHVLGNIHHAVVIGVCLIQLDGGELRVMTGVHALVAENTADLVYALQTAYDQALEVQLGRNTQIHINVQRVVVGDERTSRRTARNGVQARGLNLHKTAGIHKVADLAHDSGALLKGIAYLRVDDQVNIALTVTHIGILQTVPLLRQRCKVFGEQRQLGYGNRNLTLLGTEYLALDTDDIADIELLVALVYVLAYIVALDVKLQTAVAVAHIREGSLAHDALGHHAACQTDGLAFQLVKMLVNIGGIVIALKAHLLERVLARSLQLCQLLAANALQLVQFLRGLLVLILRLMLFCHIFPIFHKIFDGSAKQLAFVKLFGVT